VVISDLRRYHPVFKKLSYQGARMVLTNGKILSLKVFQVLYEEGERESNIYLILYGKLTLRANEILGVINSFESIGEESLFIPNYQYR